MIDLSKLGGASSGGSLPASGVTPTSQSDLPDFAPLSSKAVDPNETNGHNWVWDKLGRAVWGDQNNEQDRGLLGGIPVVGNVFRAPGAIWRGLLDAGGVGLDKGIIQPLAYGMGRIPSATGSGLGDESKVGQVGVNAWDPKYRADPHDPISVGASGAKLAQDIQAAHGHNDLGNQFLILGQWQKQYDPEAFAEWEKTLKSAGEQGPDGLGAKASEVVNNYIREWSVAYMDTTPEGVDGWLGTHPELAFGGEGSLGQGFTDDLARIFTLQQHAEKGAATLAGSGGGGVGPIPVGPHLYYGDTDYGSRLNELLYLADSDPKKLTPVEGAVILGIKEQNWTANHAYNYLLAHGQGFSHNPGVQTVLGMALDPTMVIPTGAALAASVGERAALGFAKTAVGAGRITQAYEGMAKAIGTTVQAVRADKYLGPAAKVARTVWDPLSALPAGSKEAAKADVYAAAGVKATERGFGPSAVKDMFNRADGWGVREMADRAFGTTAMNFMRKFTIGSHIDNLTKFTEPGARRVVNEDLIQELGHNAPKDAVSRGADYVYKRREFWLTEAGTQQLTDRIATATGRSGAEVAAAVAGMSRDEQAVWHAMSYSEAFTDFVTAARSVDPTEWGSLAKKLDDMVILNPHELDDVAAQALHADISALKGAKAVKAWNEAAGKYSLIENLGRVTTGGPAQLERRLNALDRIIQEGGLHTALGLDEMKSLPQAVKRDFLGKWVGSDGQPLWRIGFKPNALQATGLVYDNAGKLIAKYEPAIDNVTTAIPRTVGGVRSALDTLGRVVPDGVKDLAAAKAAGRMADGLEVAFNIAKDKVSSERVMTSMEQSFVKQMRAAGHSGQLARNIFRQSRTAAQDAGFTLAGMGPEEFWAANKELLKDVMDARVAKRDVFTMLSRAAGGDMRLLGLSAGTTQRIRSGLIARGLDPNNYMGAVTVKMYNALRYALNPTFFLQAEFDAPWFNVYRGVMPDLTGRAPKPGSAIWEMQGITEAMGHTSIARDLQMDYTERIATIGWQREVVDQLRSVPGFEQGVGERIKGRLGRMVMNNELAFINSETGNIVLDAIDTTKRSLLKRAAEAGTPEEAAMWRDQGMDIERVFEHLTETMQDELGRLPTKDEMGRRYLSEMIDDSHLEVRTREGLLDYQKVAQKGGYHVPTDIGELRPLHMDYGAESLALPNIHDAAGLKAAISDGVYTTADIKDMMKGLGYHKDHIQRFMNGITFNWRYYFDDLRNTLGMNKFEMQGVEDLVAKEARALGMEPVDYITQVLPMTVKRGKSAAATAADAASAEAAKAAASFTPREAVAAPAGMFEHTSTRGGGTFDVASGNEMGLSRGYGVADGSGGRIVDNTKDAVEGAYSEVSKTGAPHIGTWFNPSDGKVYVDPTQVVGSKVEAMRLAKARGEKAIFDFKSQASIDVAPTVDPTMGLSDHMRATLDIMRASEGSLDDVTKAVANHLQPSMKQTLLDHFMQRITGKNGMIEAAMAAGDTKAAQDLNLVLEDLKGGWGKAADNEFRDLVIRRSGGNVPTGGANTPFKAAPGIPGGEMVPTKMLERFVEIDREAVAKAPPTKITVAQLRAEVGDAEVERLAQEHPDRFMQASSGSRDPKIVKGAHKFPDGSRGDYYDMPSAEATDLDALTADIKANGIKEPITLEYDPHTGSALMTDGNHRLAAAKRAGLDEVPVVLKPAKRLPSEADLTKAPAGFVRTEVAPGAASKPSDIFKAARDIADPEVERAARYFSQYVQTLDPKLVAGDVMRGIVDNIPVEGASPHNFSQGLLMNTLAENFRLAEKDAIRLAHMSTERSVLERSINHPFFAMYPSSYFWGKVIPETFRFMATDPFGIKTGVGLNAYYHVKQSADLQSQYDPRMAALWKSLGKSAVLGLFSYLSPSMPWEDMKSNLPPWVRSLSKGEDFSTLLDKEIDTFAPHRWLSHFTDAGDEISDGFDSVVKSLSPQQQQGLQQISSEGSDGGATPPPASGFHGTVPGTALGPVLQGDLADLQAALSK